MPEWINFLFKNNKLPTLALMALFLYFGYSLIKGEANFLSPSSIAGYVILFIASLFSFSLFVEYKSREHTDHIISKYSKALDEVSKTHTAYERKQRKEFSQSQETFRSRGGRGEYVLQEESSDNVTDNSIN